CHSPMRAVMITPTRANDYRNPHIQTIWYQAERVLRVAELVCFVGCSLPDDDLEVVDLLRRGQAGRLLRQVGATGGVGAEGLASPGGSHVRLSPDGLSPFGLPAPPCHGRARATRASLVRAVLFLRRDCPIPRAASCSVSRC